MIVIISLNHSLTTTTAPHTICAPAGRAVRDVFRVG